MFRSVRVCVCDGWQEEEEAAMVAPAWARGLRGAAASALEPHREPDADPIVILARSLEEAFVGTAAWVAGGGALHSAVCTFPLLALGVRDVLCPPPSLSFLLSLSLNLPTHIDQSK
jgi:hypothetical protein